MRIIRRFASKRAGPRTGAQELRHAQAAGVPLRPAALASEPFRLMEPQQVQARGYRRQSLPFSSACLINGRVVTGSCWNRSAVLI